MSVTWRVLEQIACPTLKVLIQKNMKVCIPSLSMSVFLALGQGPSLHFALESADSVAALTQPSIGLLCFVPLYLFFAG